MTPQVLERQTVRASDASDRVRSWLAEHVPARSSTMAGVLVVIAGWTVVTGSLIGVGLLFSDVVHLGSLARWDEHASSWLADHRSELLNGLTKYLTFLANTEGIVIVAAVAVAVLGVRRRWHDAAVIVVGLVFELTAFLVTTFTIARPRPDVPRLNSTPSTFSFPSGHTAATLVLYGALAIIIGRAWRRPALTVLAWATAVALDVGVGFARVYRGMHHVSDVVAGTLLGAAALVVAFLALDVIDRARVAGRRDELGSP